MEKTDIRRGFGDDLAIQLQHEPQNAVRSWMRRPHVEHHLLTDLVLPRLAQCRVGRGHPRNRDRRFHLARRGCPGRRSYNVPARIYAGEWNFVPQAISGERTLAACWRWHSAIANFCNVFPKRIQLAAGKFVAAECRNQHATGVRYPEVPLALGSGTRLTTCPYAKKNRITFRRSGRAMRWDGTRSRQTISCRGGFVS